jgi:hypothetical protein
VTTALRFLNWMDLLSLDPLSLLVSGLIKMLTARSLAIKVLGAQWKALLVPHYKPRCVPVSRTSMRVFTSWEASAGLSNALNPQPPLTLTRWLIVAMEETLWSGPRWLAPPTVSWFGGNFEERGIFELTVRELNPLENNECRNAMSILTKNELMVQGSAFNVTWRNDEREACCEGNSTSVSGGRVWCAVEGSGSFLRASSYSKYFETMTFVYSGSCGNLECVAGSNGNPLCQEHSYGCAITSWESFANTTYHILVRPSGVVGARSFNLLLGDFTPAANGDCADTIRPQSNLVETLSSEMLSMLSLMASTPVFLVVALQLVAHCFGCRTSKACRHM